MKTKTRARIALEAGKTLFPELYRKDKNVFASTVKSIALMDKDELQRLNERCILVSRSSHFINASSADFYRLQEVYQNEKADMNKEYSNGDLEIKDYDDSNVPKENPNGNVAKNTEHWLSQIGEVVRKELAKLLPAKQKGYDYPEKNIPKESSLKQSDNATDLSGETQALIKDDQKDALERASANEANKAGEGQVLYTPVEEAPTGYSQKVDKKANVDEEIPTENIEVLAEEAVEVPEEETAYPEEVATDVINDEIEEEIPAEEIAYPEEEIPAEEEILASTDEEVIMDVAEETEMGLLFGEEEILDEPVNEVIAKKAALQKGRIPAALMVRANKQTSNVDVELKALFGEEI